MTCPNQADRTSDRLTHVVHAGVVPTPEAFLLLLNGSNFLIKIVNYSAPNKKSYSDVVSLWAVACAMCSVGAAMHGLEYGRGDGLSSRDEIASHRHL